MRKIFSRGEKSLYDQINKEVKLLKEDRKIYKEYIEDLKIKEREWEEK